MPQDVVAYKQDVVAYKSPEMPVKACRVSFVKDDTGNTGFVHDMRKTVQFNGHSFKGPLAKSMFDDGRVHDSPVGCASYPKRVILYAVWQKIQNHKNAKFTVLWGVIIVFDVYLAIMRVAYFRQTIGFGLSVRETEETT